MSFIPPDEFEKHCTSLAVLLAQTASLYVKDHKLGNFTTESAQRQCSFNLTSIAQELLMFGGDVWPDGADENDPDEVINEDKPKLTVIDGGALARNIEHEDHEEPLRKTA